MVIASVIAALLSFFMVFSMKRSGIYNFREIYYRAYGKKLGSFLLLLYALMLLLTSIESAAVEASAIKTNIFMETPLWYLLLFFIVPAIYPLKKGYIAIFIASILTVIFLYFSEAIIAVMTEQYKHYSNLLPIAAKGFTPELLKSTLQILGLYGSIFIIFPYIKDIKDKKKLKHHFLWGVIIVAVVSIVNIIGLLAIFGPYRAGNIFYPKLLQSQRIYFGGFIEFGELFMILQIVSNLLIKYILAFYSIILLYKNFFDRNKYFYYIISIIIFVGAYFVSKNNIAFLNFLTLYSYISLIGYIIIPFITFTLILLKKHNN